MPRLNEVKMFVKYVFMYSFTHLSINLMLDLFLLRSNGYDSRSDYSQYYLRCYITMACF